MECFVVAVKQNPVDSEMNYKYHLFVVIVAESHSSQLW